MAEPHPQAIDPAHPLVDRVRAICLPLPEAVEVISRGRPHFRAGKGTIFASTAVSMDRPFTLAFRADDAERPALLEDSRFFIPQYSGAYGWLATDIDGDDVDWQYLAELVETSYRGMANSRQLKALDSRDL